MWHNRQKRCIILSRLVFVAFVAFCCFLVVASAFSCILFFVIVVVAYFYCVFAVFCKKIIILNACIRSVQRNSEWENILSNRRIHQRCVYFRLLLLILHSFYSVLTVLTLSTTGCMVQASPFQTLPWDWRYHSRSQKSIIIPPACLSIFLPISLPPSLPLRLPAFLPAHLFVCFACLHLFF